MCDNLKSLEEQNIESSCAPCVNDPIGCQASNIRHVIANNLSVLNAYKNMKCAILAYINSVSVEFVQSIDHADENLERARFNVLVESLIAGIHQSLRGYTNGQIEPYFQLWIQKQDSNGDDIYDLGAGWIDNQKSSGCYDGEGNVTADTYDTCTGTWVGDKDDVKYEPGNLAKLYPSKISVFSNCNKNNAIQGDEILYHYNPTVQLLYNPTVSSLTLKWADANYNYDSGLGFRQSCIFPLLSDESSFKSNVYSIVPPSPRGPGDNDDIWDIQENAYNFVRNDCLLQNHDLKTIISQLDIIIRRCELTHQSLKLKLKMSQSDVIINAFDITT